MYLLKMCRENEGEKKSIKQFIIWVVITFDNFFVSLSLSPLDTPLKFRESYLNELDLERPFYFVVGIKVALFFNKLVSSDFNFNILFVDSPFSLLVMELPSHPFSVLVLELPSHPFSVLVLELPSHPFSVLVLELPSHPFSYHLISFFLPSHLFSYHLISFLCLFCNYPLI